MSQPEPQKLSQALSDLIAMRGWARLQGDQQLAQIWKTIAGEQIASQTRVSSIQRGILLIFVRTSALMNQLVSFHRPALLKQLQEQRPDLKIRDLKFKLKGDLRT